MTRSAFVGYSVNLRAMGAVPDTLESSQSGAVLSGLLCAVKMSSRAHHKGTHTLSVSDYLASSGADIPGEAL